jgi:hypothetical protein
MTAPEEEDRRPGVYARMAQEAEVRYATRTPPWWARYLGWILCLALAGGVVAAALRVHPW